MKKRFIFVCLGVTALAHAETQIWKSVDPETGHIIFSSQPKGNKASVFKPRNTPKISVSESGPKPTNVNVPSENASNSWDVTQDDAQEIKNIKPAIPTSGMPPPMALPPLPKK